MSLLRCEWLPQLLLQFHQFAALQGVAVALDEVAQATLPALTELLIRPTLRLALHIGLIKPITELFGRVAVALPLKAERPLQARHHLVQRAVLGDQRGAILANRLCDGHHHAALLAQRAHHFNQRLRHQSHAHALLQARV